MSTKLIVVSNSQRLNNQMVIYFKSLNVYKNGIFVYI